MGFVVCFFFFVMAGFCYCGDRSVYFDWEISFINVALLGVDQKVIAVNKQFPGPIVSITTNDNVVVNVQNNLDEPFLLTWNGIQQRRNCWQDGVLGTTCPIPPGWNWTYSFQVKDQIGSFFYSPSLAFQRAAGGFGGITLNNRIVIPVPFGKPHGDFTIFIGDWFTQNHADLRNKLNNGHRLGMPHGVLINGKGPYRYNDTLVPDGIDYATFDVNPGKTYRIRVHNVGISTSLNFRIQNHNLLLVETEGTYTVQQNYTSLDIHVGQSYSFLVTMDQNASTDYYMVASARFVDKSSWASVTGVSILHYSNSKGKASGPLPDPPNDVYDRSFSMNQARSIRTNVSAGAARPNPQGSFHYGSINVTQVYHLENKIPVKINGKLRAAINGISYSPPKTPLRLADEFGVKGVYTLDFPNKPLTGPPRISSSVINGSYRGFIEIILQNNATTVESYHLDGYSFWIAGMGFGVWTENSRNSYNKWDGVARCTTQVFPGAWTAILVSLDNVGIWNLRTQNLDSWYLGQELYIRAVNPDDTEHKTELPLPDNALFCGQLSDKQKPQEHRAKSASSILSPRSELFILLILLATAASLLLV